MGVNAWADKELDMRVSVAVLAAAVAAGCGKGGSGEDSGTGTGGTTAPSLSFKAQVNSKAVSGGVTAAGVDAQRATNLLMGAIGLAFADGRVRAGLAGIADPGTQVCWYGPGIPQSYFTLDYTPCEDQGISGGLIFNDDPLGPVGLDFKNVGFGGTRHIDGAVGLDDTGAENLHWAAYDTDGDQPVSTNRIPFDVTVDGVEGTLTFDGGVFLRALNNNTAAWGVVQFQPYGGDPVQVLVGGTDAAALTGAQEAPEPASLTWAYESCRCPTVGLYAMELTYEVREVDFDLDDLLEGDDAVDDPVVTLQAGGEVSGPVEARMTDCGEWDIAFTGEATLDVPVSSDELKDAIQNLCDTAVIADGERCTALLLAADKVSEVTVQVGANRLANAIANDAAIDFDNAYCRP